jgi:DNA-binding NtrC family response regulator
MNILYIEDDMYLANSLVPLFEQKGNKVYHVFTYLDAATVMKNATIDLVLSDWDLGLREPMDGGEIVSALMSVNPDARYIIYSGLRRTVPDGAEFVSKGSLYDLLEMVKGI